MDGQVEPEQARDAGRTATWAVVLAGVGQFLAWSAFLAYSIATTDVVTPLAYTGTVEALALGAVVLVALLVGGWAAAHVVQHQRPWVAAWRSILAVVAALLVVALVTFLYDVVLSLLGTDGFWRPPAIGATIGAQLAVLLPGSDLRQVIRRVSMPVLVDIGAAVVAEPLEAQSGWGALGLAIAWFVLALATVAWVERAAITRQAAAQPTRPDDHAFS